MTDPVETLARALWDESYPPPIHPGDMDHHREMARALLAQITPALVAEEVAKERKRWEAMSMVDFASQLTGRSIAAIRSRTP